jgi:alpha-beta hydrolase superfamily lysophospholipase
MTFTQFSNVPISPYHIVPKPFVSTDLWWSAHIFYDLDESSAIIKRPPLIYFHGSGETGYPSEGSNLISGLRALGFNVIAARSHGAGDSSEGVDNGYGNVNSPNFFGSTFRYAYWVQAFIEFVDTQKATFFTDVPSVLMGHSMGANACVSWSSLSHIFGSTSKVSAIWGNGLAIGGEGNKVWVDIWAAINNLSHSMIEAKHPTLLSLGKNEE